MRDLASESISVERLLSCSWNESEVKTGFYGTDLWVLACPAYSWAKAENIRIKIGPSRYISVLAETG